MSDHLLLDKGAWWKDGEVYLYATSHDKEPGCRVDIQTGDPAIFFSGTLIRTQPFADRLPSHGLLPGATIHSIIPISGRKLGEIAAWPLVRGWLGYCAKVHTHNTRPDLFQTGNRTVGQKWASCFRLVDVRNKCVIEAHMSFRYAALSYVWGGSEPIRLCSQNVRELMTRGGLNRLSYLPKTFRDAIHITEQLEIDYLWIDALCIQHDDNDDLDHQINGMDKIYREATITIVSVTANADFEIPGLRTGTRNTASLQYNNLGVDLMYARPRLTDAIRQCHWETRGWTLQEKFFSKRLLYFTTDQIYFQCADAIWAEDAVLEPQDFHRLWESSTEQCMVLDHANHLPEPVQPRTLSFTTEDESDSRLFDDFFQYQDLLQEYMRRNLTRDTDILAAFSGILNSLEDRLGAPIFGLPERIFDVSLLWYGDLYAKRRPQFPSWSWCGWVAGRSRELSWLVADNLQDGAYAWVLPPRTNQPRLVEIRDLAFRAERSNFEISHTDHKFIVPMPQPLWSLRDLTLDSRPKSYILEFKADTFFDPKYIRGEVEVALNNNLHHDRCKGRPVPQSLGLLVMSGSRIKDTWFKRRQGTYALPPAPGEHRHFPLASVNVMLIKTDEHQISERIWVFSIVMERRVPNTVRKTIYLS